jgi:hypothetical protein
MRLYPSDELVNISEIVKNGYEAHKSSIFNKLNYERVKFEMHPQRDGSMEFHLLDSASKIAFSVPASPVESSLIERARLYNFP